MTENSFESEANQKRISIITGHFGSGKTEFAINYALKSKESDQYEQVSLIDLDIANPYFRSREKQSLLNSKGIAIISNTFGYDINLDLPAISAAINGPIQNKSCRVIIDAGGNDSGARVLTQFKNQLLDQRFELLCVINANRYETGSLADASHHISAIEDELGLKITGLVNNTHMLTETTFADLIKGMYLCRDLSFRYAIPIKYHCCAEKFEGELRSYINQHDDPSFSGTVFPMTIYMRSSWLDR